MGSSIHHVMIIKELEVEKLQAKLSFLTPSNQVSENLAKAYNTWDSQAVSDPSTNQAQRCLTCQIGRDGVFSTWYGRK